LVGPWELGDLEAAKVIAVGAANLIALVATRPQVRGNRDAPRIHTRGAVDEHEEGRLQELVRLHRMETGTRRVARMPHMSPNTERNYRKALEAKGCGRVRPRR
jgi:hypothetical protein